MGIFDKRDQEASLFRQKQERTLGRQIILLRTLPLPFYLYLRLLILYLVFTRIVLK